MWHSRPRLCLVVHTAEAAVLHRLSLRLRIIRYYPPELTAWTGGL
jgi:hypothetical protein